MKNKKKERVTEKLVRTLNNPAVFATAMILLVYWDIAPTEILIPVICSNTYSYYGQKTPNIC